MVDPLSTGLVISLIANGVTTLAAYGANKLKQRKSLVQDFQAFMEGDTEVISNIQAVLQTISLGAASSGDPARTALVRIFLESPSTESIVRQIFCDHLDLDGQRQSAGELLEEFTLSFSLHLGISSKEGEKDANALFDVIIDNCRRVLDFAVERGILAAHEAKDTARYRIMLDELHAIRKYLEFLKPHDDIDFGAIDDFEKIYRAQIGDRQRMITIPNFDKASRVHLDDMFVPPEFSKLGMEPEGPDTRKPMESFYAGAYRMVVLGDPGGGKSTLAQKICYDLATHYEDRLIAGRLLTPVPVLLRDYSSMKREDNTSIVEFMQNEVTSKYQIPEGAPKGTFENLLHNGRILVVFDGLDELLDPHQRRGVRADIESFCNLFPSVPVIVTSRVVGYEQAPLDPRRFSVCNLTPFNDNQVEDYAQKWFMNSSELAESEAKDRAIVFLSESLLVQDLRSNPLMLALMCSLYRGTGYIPRNRPEVYRKCSEMLFERWDPSRGIWHDLPISEPRRLLTHLAHWMYQNDALQGGVLENDLIKEAVNFLYPRSFDNEETAEKAAKEFIEWCLGRAWVFTDAGTTPTGNSLFKFTHQTFLEFFTALFLVRNYGNPESLWGILGPKIATESWDMIAQLSFQMLHEQAEGASDDLLTLLLKDAGDEHEHSWEYLNFGARCLRFLYPSPKIIQDLTGACITYLIDSGTTPSRPEVPPLDMGVDRPPAMIGRLAVNSSVYLKMNDYGDSIYEEKQQLIRSLLSSVAENRTVVANTFVSQIANFCDAGTEEDAVFASTLGLRLSRFMVGSEINRVQEAILYWRNIEQTIAGHVQCKMKDLAPKNFLAFIHSIEDAQDAADNVLNWYTPAHLFWQAYDTPFGVVHWNSLAYWIGTMGLQSVGQRGEPRSNQNECSFRAAGVIGSRILKMNMPCISDIDRAQDDAFSPSAIRITNLWDSKERRLAPDVSDSLAGIWSIWASFSERFNISREIEMGAGPLIWGINDSIFSRQLNDSPDSALAHFRDLGVSQESLAVIKNWILRQFNFVEPQRSD